MKIVKTVLIEMACMVGCLFIGYGLWEIYPPMAWIFIGIILLLLSYAAKQGD